MLLRAVPILLVFGASIFLSVTVAAQPVRMGIPERKNLQYMSFWIAQGAGLFKAQGLAVERNATLYPARPTMPDFTRVRAADFVARHSPNRRPGPKPRNRASN